MNPPITLVFEVDQPYLNFITESRRKNDPAAPAATMDEIGRYCMLAICNGFQDRSNALNAGDRLIELWNWISWYQFAE